ncbi:MAG: M15 family metallopeptidase [Clostridia bacterium]|nr:M15 family metallopeptidase [Clostridia bacterium]
MLAKLLSLLLTLLSLGQTAVEAYVNEACLGGNLFLVNRDYAITADYVPNDLVTPKVLGGNDTTMMRAEAAGALEELFAAAKEEEGYVLVAVSGYRSYGKQASIHQRKIQTVGKKEALRVSAPAGCSEHQLGLAMDVGRKSNTNLSKSFGDSPEGQWVAENAHRFGFIIRYKAEWEDVTGYMYEPWHIRYVGKDHAARIYELDIPFEYYVAQLRAAQAALAGEGAE